MTLRYCTKCQQSIAEQDSIQQDTHYHCPTCNTRLHYFGKETATLSIDTVIAEYDLLHPFKPLADFTGKFVNYEAISSPIPLLECETKLRHCPDDKPSLRYLRRHYTHSGNLTEALRYANRLCSTEPPETADIHQAISLHFATAAYDTVLSLLTTHRSHCTPFYVAHHTAAAFLGQKKLKKALYWFHQSRLLCAHKQTKQKINGVMADILTLLKQAAS